MKKKNIIWIVRWAARLTTVIPLAALLFITFEDAPHHYPWSPGGASIIWTLIFYLSVMILLLSWKWEFLGTLSIIGFVAIYIWIIQWSIGLFNPAGLLVCCTPGLLFLILIILKLTWSVKSGQ